jgi:hypothetical protein
MTLEKYRIDLCDNEQDVYLLCQFLFDHNIEEWDCRRIRHSSILSPMSYYVMLNEESVTYLTIMLEKAKIKKIDENHAKFSDLEFKTRLGIRK